jgi:DNA-damage-inducible protein J
MIEKPADLARVSHLCYIYRYGEKKMRKSAIVRTRIEPGLKREAEKLLARLGLTASQAITLFYRQVTLRKGLPFDIVIPNATTRRVFEDTDADRNLVVCSDADDMFKKLGI